MASTGADFDYSAYLGEEGYGVYVDVKKRRRGWYIVATVDGEHFTEALPDDGPYKTRAEAAQAAIYGAMDILFENDVRVTKKDQKAALKFLMTP
jgi:hypothetical protein